MTARELISGSLRLIGAIAPGETMAAAEATDALATLNALLDSLSNDSLMVHKQTEETPITLIPGTQDYTLGSGGSISTRPMYINTATISSSGLESELQMLTASEWAAITNKTQSGKPRMLFDNGGYPTRTISLYPVPSAADTLNLITLRPLTSFAALTDSVSLPPGYERMLRFNLAIDLAPEYGKTVSPEVAKTAQESKAMLEVVNQRMSLLRCDDAAGMSSGGSFNFESGGFV